jgi:hypothetical protein
MGQPEGNLPLADKYGKKKVVLPVNSGKGVPIKGLASNGR